MPESDTTESSIDVTVSVDGIELDEQQQSVVDVYEENIETFIKKNESYGGSFENSAKLESILRHGEVRHDELFDIISEQILVRGFYDKLSRFHQLQIQGTEDRVGEAVDDTLLDMGNYAIMLAAMRRKYNEHQPFFGMPSGDTVWAEEDIAEFMDKYSNEAGETVVTGLTDASDE